MDNTFIKKIEKLYLSKQFNQIIFEIEKLTEIEKKNPFILNLQGIIESANKNLPRAKFYFEEALKQDPYYLHSLLNYAGISHNDKSYNKIIFLLKKYNEKNPNNPKVLLNLADLTFSAGYVQDSIKFHKELIKSKNYGLRDLTALIFLLNYDEKFSEQEYDEYCILFNKIAAQNVKSLNIKQVSNDKLKIGFLSNDLREHPVGYFLIDVIKNITSFSTVAFNLFKSNNSENKIIKELKNSFSEWYDVADLNSEELGNFIHGKKINCLFDLDGYNSGNKIEVFKKKPAPIQISWLGYLNSTKIKEMDYLIADPYIIPKEKESFYSEKLIRMPNIWNAHSKLSNIKINDLPALKKNYFTFGSFNNFHKISNETAKVWGEILNNVTNSRLVLKTLDNVDKDYEDYLIKKLNLKKEKIFFLKTEKDKNKHLQHYNEIDIALDTFPYNGVTTSFESIWMGVPVLTKIGNNYSSRCGYSINKNLRLEEFIAIDNEDYISKAISFSSEKNLNNLNNLRKSLREKAASSVLFDGKLFAENFSKKILEVVNKPI